MFGLNSLTRRTTLRVNSVERNWNTFFFKTKFNFLIWNKIIDNNNNNNDKLIKGPRNSSSMKNKKGEMLPFSLIYGRRLVTLQLSTWIVYLVKSQPDLRSGIVGVWGSDLLCLITRCILGRCNIRVTPEYSVYGFIFHFCSFINRPSN